MMLDSDLISTEVGVPQPLDGIVYVAPEGVLAAEGVVVMTESDWRAIQDFVRFHLHLGDGTLSGHTALRVRGMGEIVLSVEEAS